MTLKGLAHHLGLSPATISLVINHSPAARSIPATTKDRILAAARELNYRPNPLARSLRSRRSSTIGVLLPEISEGYIAQILSGADSYLLNEGYFFLVTSYRTKPQMLAEYLHILQERLVEGLMVLNTPLDASPPLPTVAVAGHRQLKGVTNVVVDHDRAAYLALSHLAQLGHERIAFFKGHAKSADTEDRWRAITIAAQNLGLKIRPHLVLQLEGPPGAAAFTPEEGYREGYEFGRKLLARRVPFSSLFAFNDLSAIGAIRAFNDSGYTVPGDISVVGFDDIESAAFQNPRLTTVRQPLGEMGEIAARTLLNRIRGTEAVPDTIMVEPVLVNRESVAPPAARISRRRGDAS
jgi:LacI family transcriptional regulator